MECSEARQLIDQGLRPASTKPQRAALGFHLLSCLDCCAYRDEQDAQGLLATLLAGQPPATDEPAVPPTQPRAVQAAAVAAPDEVRQHYLRQAGLVVSTPTATPAPITRRLVRRPGPPMLRRQRRPARWWCSLIVGLLALLALSTGLMLGRISRAAYTISSNLSAMQITAAPTRLPPTPTVALEPSPSAVATSTPQLIVKPPAVGAAAPFFPGMGVKPLMLGTATPTPGPFGFPTPILLPPIGLSPPPPTRIPTVGAMPVSAEAINVLLLGSDRRPGESWQTRSDAIMIVRLEPTRQRIALLSFPRDLIVNIPGYGYARINAATVYGDMDPELGGGLELARSTVSELTGLPIHYVVRADFNAFITAIDAIGGVDLVVEHELYDAQYPTMDYGYTVAHFLPGPQHMDGQTALMYARLRHADSDYYRARRQQQVIQAIMQRVRQENLLGKVQMLADLSDALRDDLQTDLSLNQMLGIAWAFRSFSPNQVERYSLDENLTSAGAAGDPYALTAAPGAIPYVVGQLLGNVER